VIGMSADNITGRKLPGVSAPGAIARRKPEYVPG